MGLYITVNNTAYDFGIITSVSNTYTRSSITTPIPSMPTDRTFAIETSASLEYSISFVRKCPLPDEISLEDYTRSDHWDNGTWLSRVSSLTNRWQARTNGYVATMTKGEKDGLGTPEFTERVYISDVSYSYKEGEPDNIYGTITLIPTNQLGQNEIQPLSKQGSTSITGYGALENKEIYTDATSYVILTNSKNTQMYILQKGKEITTEGAKDFEIDFSKKSDIIKGYEIHGGPADPFEYVTLSISRKELIEQCEELDGDILAGCNQIMICGPGKMTGTVTKCRLNNKTYSVTAYCNAEQIRGHVTPGDNSSSGQELIGGTPLNIITNLITSYAAITSDSIITNCEDINKSIRLRAGVNTWTAVQFCAMILNAKCFFAGGKFYLIDYTKLCTTNDQGVTYGPTYTGLLYGNLDLHPSDPSDPLADKVTGNITIGSEGMDTLINVASLHYATVPEEFADGKTYNVDKIKTITEGGSVEKYTKFEYNELQIDSIMYVDKNDPDEIKLAEFIAEKIGNFIINYRAEPQTSIGFTLKERIDSGSDGLSTSLCSWQRSFPYVCSATGIFSDAEQVNITASSTYSFNGGTPVLKPQKLMLSSFKHNYPDFTTDYKFGVIENIDLSQSTSKITTSLQIK